MLPDQVSNPGPLTYESGALPIALRGPVAIPLKISFVILSTIYHSSYCFYIVRHLLYIFLVARIKKKKKKKKKKGRKKKKKKKKNR